MKNFLFTFVYCGWYIIVLNSCGLEQPKQILTDSLSIADGERLFQQNCSGCHNFRQNGIGPNLSGITLIDSPGWLRNFIHDPSLLVSKGDARAKKILDSFHTLMPSFLSLNERELDHLIAFLHLHKKPLSEKPDPLAIKDPVPEKIKASTLELNLELIAQIPPSSNDQPLTRISKMDWNPFYKTWFVLDQRGFLYKLEAGKPILWFEISTWKKDFINQPGLATGLGSFAFDPEFSRNGIFYTTHCEKAHSKRADFSISDSVKQTLQWVLCAWKVDNLRSKVFTGSCRELMRIDMVAGIHGVQEIVFNPLAKKGDKDFGNLYIGVGDGGSSENGFTSLTRHPGNVWGTILRINPRTNNSANGNYGIPSDNPFAQHADSGSVREIYAYGFRNPNRISWMHNKTMLATNIGQANIESINIILRGQNYG